MTVGVKCSPTSVRKMLTVLLLLLFRSTGHCPDEGLDPFPSPGEMEEPHAPEVQIHQEERQEVNEAPHLTSVRVDCGLCDRREQEYQDEECAASQEPEHHERESAEQHGVSGKAGGDSPSEFRGTVGAPILSIVAPVSLVDCPP